MLCNKGGASARMLQAVTYDGGGGLKMAIFSGRYFLDDLSLEIAHQNFIKASSILTVVHSLFRQFAYWINLSSNYTRTLFCNNT